MANVSTVTEADVEGLWDAVHPGEVLWEEFLQEWGVSQRKLALAIGVAPQRISEIVHGKRRIRADTALRLAQFFGTTAGFWLNLQTMYDLEREAEVLGDLLEAITPLDRA
ncbi:HigA antitoxin [Pontimonas salivibrio]|uniref:HigA antitoxin n=1 Tax=Pontimonas salivibrio TaxID=1159327 RepID=A0A2L2BPD6_9MICO|nr:HigA family addiction module antitoxin [Pontimonas salivibrio]AVG23531.1 HigA antitoxin [Pontimonas salivibrio]